MSAESSARTVRQADGLDPVRALQRVLYRSAKQDRARRFHARFDKLARSDVMWRAWVDVATNQGAPGVDGVTIASIADGGVESVRAFLDGLAGQLRTGTYRPKPLRRVYIPKPGRPGESRPLGIPAVADRVIMSAAKIVLEPIFEADFHPVSFGFRPRRSAQQALEAVRQAANQGRGWVLDADIKACFDNIDHDALMGLVERRVVDRQMLKLLRSWLRAGVFEGGVVSDVEAGTPQGSPVSPLLANIALHVLDEAWARTGWQLGTLVRFADDCVTRMHRRHRCRRPIYPMQCCAEDGGRSSGVALQGEAPNHRKLRRSRAGVVSVAEKAGFEPVRCEPRRRAEANHPMTGRKRMYDIKSGVESLPRYESGGNLSTAQAVSGLKVA